MHCAPLLPPPSSCRLPHHGCHICLQAQLLNGRLPHLELLPQCVERKNSRMRLVEWAAGLQHGLLPWLAWMRGPFV